MVRYRMKRRDFFGLLSGAAAYPLAARAQSPTSKMPLIGILDSAGGNDAYWTAFRRQLETLGWRANIEVRQAGADAAQAVSFATDLVSMKPAVIVANNPPTTKALLAQTRDIPIVFIQVPDPIGSGLVSQFARPGRNVTGFTNFEPSIAGKWLQLLKEAVPDLGRVAVVLDAGVPSRVLYEQAIEGAAAKFAVAVSAAIVADGRGIDSAIEKFAREPRGGIIVPSSALAVSNRDRIIGLASRYRLPAMYAYSDFATSGGLMSYGIDRLSLYKQAAAYVARILGGERVGDLPVQAPTKFELVINLRTAKALGLTVPEATLLLADEVIE
jgi:putative ABC transport system substrate-binding protein